MSVRITPVSWIVRGFAGLLQMLEAMQDAGEKMEPETLGELEQHLARLQKIVIIQRQRR